MRKLLILLLLVSSAAMATKISCKDVPYPEQIKKGIPGYFNDETSRCVSSEMTYDNNAMSMLYLVTKGFVEIGIYTKIWEGDKLTENITWCTKAQRPGYYVCISLIPASDGKWTTDNKKQALTYGQIADVYFSSMIIKPADERHLFFNQAPPWAQ